MGEVLVVDGPIVTARVAGVCNGEQVRIGELELVGEVISLDGERVLVQVHESTESLRPGERVEALGHPLSVELGPGLLGRIFDGVQRPLATIKEIGGDRLARGLSAPALDREKTWRFVPNDDLGNDRRATPGMLLGTVEETGTIEHRILVPPGVEGALLESAPEGDYRVEDAIGRIRTADGHIHELKLFHRWPVRVPRPYSRRDHEAVPLITGQRILDTFFPLLKGGKAAIPGPFGAGKTVLQQQIARWSNADIVLFVGCGERGNELVEILEQFPKLEDPLTNRPLMERTLLVANTSNMPVVAREASIYTGVTIAEYYRDQGYDVVMVADSTSRWAEALREVSGRLGQMPVEEGYPADLASRLAAFYERAGRVRTLSDTLGSVTVIGAVSPPGGDFSEPVTSHTKEIVRTFWALSKELADARHYPAIDWNGSFSGYVDTAARWWEENTASGWAANRSEALALLSQADELARIVNLVGPEALSSEQRWILEGAGLIREGVLQQSALDPVDSYASPQKQAALVNVILTIYRLGAELVALGAPAAELAHLPVVIKAKRIKAMFDSAQVEGIEAFAREIRDTFSRLTVEYRETAGAGS